MEARPINDHERALVTAILAAPGDGFEALRVQLPAAKVVGGCECGCGTINFVFDDGAADRPDPLRRTQSIHRRASRMGRAMSSVASFCS